VPLCLVEDLYYSSFGSLEEQKTISIILEVCLDYKSPWQNRRLGLQSLEIERGSLPNDVKQLLRQSFDRSLGVRLSAVAA
jgi:hypothetical protein